MSDKQYPINKITDKRFWGFMVAQFLGALNDNAFKLVISMAAVTIFADPEVRNNYISITNAASILPFLFFSGYAGYLSDRFRKSTILKITKAFEIPIMATAMVVLSIHVHMELLIMILFFMLTHSTFFSPAKYGILPELMPPALLTKANSYLNTFTFMAIIMGSVAGSALWQHFQHNPTIIGVILFSIAIVGTICILMVPRTEQESQAKKFHINPLHENIQAWPLIKSNPLLKAGIIGVAAFWMLGALLYLTVILLGRQEMGVNETMAGSLFAAVAVGIGIGSMIAGHHKGKAEHRLRYIPLGFLLLALGCMLVPVAMQWYWATVLCMICVGTGGGLYMVPLITILQEEAPADRRGQVIAFATLADMLGVLTTSGIFWVASNKWGMLPHEIIFALGIVGLCTAVLVLFKIPVMAEAMFGSLVARVARNLYRVQRIGTLHPTASGTILTSNHLSFMDGLILWAHFYDQDARFLVHPKFFQAPVIGWALKAVRAVPFGGSLADNKRGIKLARQHLAESGYVFIFPEGGITRTGYMNPFKRGISKLTEGIAVQVVPVHLDGLWGSPFSYKGQKFFSSWPVFRRTVTLSIGQPIPAPVPLQTIYAATQELGQAAWRRRYQHQDTLARRFVAIAKQHLWFPVVADATGRKLNYLKLLVAARLLSRKIKPSLSSEMQHIGIMLPASVAGVLANLTAALSGKIPVNLNFSLGEGIIRQCMQQADIRLVLTSRLFIEKMGLEPQPHMLFLEDLRPRINRIERFLTIVQVLLLPAGMLARHWKLSQQSLDDTATVMFSSGTTAIPKGIRLSHYNILSNVDQVRQLLTHAEAIMPEKPLSMLGVLPFFHSFGYTVTLWLPLLDKRQVFFQPSPLEAKQVCAHIAEQKSGILLATPTFAANYVRTAKEGQLNSLRLVVLGGEKLSNVTRTALQTALPEAHILEGYGCTELGPVVSVNFPDVVTKDGTIWQTQKVGSVGKPLPNVMVRIVDRETGKHIAEGGEGIIEISTPGRMQGYLHQPAPTDNWYNTGDIGILDADGFLYITDRQSRFSKIGGEMIPHAAVEAVIDDILGDKGCVVIALPDRRKGEKLYVLYVHNTYTAKELAESVLQSTLPTLWQPAADAYHSIEALPVLPTGKIDLRRAREIIESRLDKKSKDIP